MMAEVAASHRFETIRLLNASREVVFAAWTDLEKFMQWWGPETRHCPHAEIDLRPGGQWRACMRASDGDEAWVGGEYREVAPPSKLVFTWAWERGGMPGPSTIVTVELTDRGNQTELRLVHEGFESAEVAAAHDDGWGSSMISLERYLNAAA
jgi:uncharacterized protein YndB with AHSA1/START domain